MSYHFPGECTSWNCVEARATLARFAGPQFVVIVIVVLESCHSPILYLQKCNFVRVPVVPFLRSFVFFHDIVIRIPSLPLLLRAISRLWFLCFVSPPPLLLSRATCRQRCSAACIPGLFPHPAYFSSLFTLFSPLWVDNFLLYSVAHVLGTILSWPGCSLCCTTHRSCFCPLCVFGPARVSRLIPEGFPLHTRLCRKTTQERISFRSSLFIITTPLCSFRLVGLPPVKASRASPVTLYSLPGARAALFSPRSLRPYPDIFAWLRFFCRLTPGLCVRLVRFASLLPYRCRLSFAPWYISSQCHLPFGVARLAPPFPLPS